MSAHRGHDASKSLALHNAGDATGVSAQVSASQISFTWVSANKRFMLSMTCDFNDVSTLHYLLVHQNLAIPTIFKAFLLTLMKVLVANLVARLVAWDLEVFLVVRMAHQ